MAEGGNGGPREQVGGKIFVTIVHKVDGQESEENEEGELEVRRFETEPAHIRANYGMTLNLGNYESARVDVSVTLPCYTEEIPGAFKKAWEIAKEQIQEQVKGIKQKGR